MIESLIDLNAESLKYVLQNEYNEPAFRAKQILGWLYKGAEISDMKNLPSALRENLRRDYNSFSLSMEAEFNEPNTETTKYLFRTSDNILIESVVLTYEQASSICISTQAGCRMGCAFCSSGENGLIRNLTAGEMLSQIIIAQKYKSSRISNIVLMGSGEPLDNYDNVKDFIRRANDPDGLNISIRNITLSTCGLVSGIKRMIKDELFVNLSLSLHAPTHDLRQEIMPVEKSYNINEAVAACKKYREASSRRVTLEYCLIENFNDTEDCAQSLYELVKDTDMLVNLIDVNTGNKKFAKNSAQCMRNFTKKLKSHNINYTIRRRLGSSINAACGQLRSKYAGEQNGGA